MKTRRMLLPDGWYPKSQNSCEKDIQHYLSQYHHQDFKGNWIGGVVPHAGWYYSGKLACEIIYLLSLEEKPDIIAVIGGHLRPNDSIGYLDYDSFETPFGDIEVDQNLLDSITHRLKEKAKTDTAMDNTVEIQLPFVKYFFPDSKVVAFRSPPSTLSQELGKVLAEEAQNSGLSIKFIGSTDLTHYGPNYGFMPKGSGESALNWMKNTNDQEYIHLIKTMEGQKANTHSLKNSSACSSGGAVTCLEGSKAFANRDSGKLIDYYTSYDIRQDSSFVGYAGILF